jgi:uncharacterized protein YcaQ
MGLMLEVLAARGQVAVVGRRGKQRVWDLAERWYPETEELSWSEAETELEKRRWRSLGVRLLRGKLLAHPDADDRPVPRRVTFVSPFDRLVHDRVRAEELFDFEYTLEMYKPAAKRRWGYFALPILHGDRLVGKLDATADRKTGVLRVNAIHEDVTFTAAITAAVRREIDDLARWLELDVDR